MRIAKIVSEYTKPHDVLLPTYLPTLPHPMYLGRIRSTVIQGWL